MRGREFSLPCLNIGSGHVLGPVTKFVDLGLLFSFTVNPLKLIGGEEAVVALVESCSCYKTEYVLSQSKYPT